MTSKVLDLLKTRNIVVPKLLLMNYKVLKITDKELIVLIYLIDNNEFDPEKISNDLNISTVDLLNIINSLIKKDIVKIESISKNKVREEYVNLDELYNKLVLKFMGEKENNKETNIYDIFEKEFGRTLSPMEYQIIGGWLEDKFTEEIITLALKEAIYNGVTRLNYIDKILYEWRKKGIKTEKDIEKQRHNFNKKGSKKEVYDYDWLNEQN